MQTTIAQYPRGMKSSWRHLTSFKGSVSSVWAAASPGDHRTTTERATTQRSCWVERPVESHHRQIFFLYVNWTLILVATPHEESLIWPHFPSPNLLPPYKPPSPEPLTSWPWAAKLGTLLWGATSKIPQTTVLSRAESPTSPVWRWPLLGDELTCVLGGEGRVTFTDPCCSSVIETQFVSRDVNTWTVEPPPACPEVDPARSSSHVPWAPHGPGPELSLPTPQWWPVSVEDNLWRQSVPHTAPEDYIHLISGYSIMYFFHLQIINILYGCWIFTTF